MESVVIFSSIFVFGIVLLTVALFVAIYFERSGKSLNHNGQIDLAAWLIEQQATLTSCLAATKETETIQMESHVQIRWSDFHLLNFDSYFREFLSNFGRHNSDLNAPC